jgi:hypothetical protein
MNGLRFVLLAAVVCFAACSKPVAYTVWESFDAPNKLDPFAVLALPTQCRNLILAASAHDYLVGTVTPEPLKGALLSGNLQGFGVRQVHNDSDNGGPVVNVIYHAPSGEGAEAKARQMGCL